MATDPLLAPFLLLLAVFDPLSRHLPAKYIISDAQVGLDDTPVPTPAPIDPTSADGPFNGVAAEIPGVVEAEEFDYGGPGVGYSDTDSTNNGGVRDRLTGRQTRRLSRARARKSV